jgi:hypothetical protein
MHISVACENDGEYGDATCITTTPESEYATTGNGGDWVAFVPHDRRHAANARLIAAAPELLAACKYLLENAEAAGWSEFMLSDAKAAISKAEGRGE